jgi:hypothetical protein
MTSLLEESALILIKTQVKPEYKKEFAHWQADFNKTIASFSGFVSLEFLQIDSNLWSIVQRFSSEALANIWLASQEFLVLKNSLKKLSQSDIQIEIKQASQVQNGITEIFITRSLNNTGYREWSSKIHEIEASFSGFKGVYTQALDSNSEQWLTLLQFDTNEHLENWLQSSERRQLLDESAPYIASLESHRIVSPYAGWFSNIATINEIPPVWKQTLLVLLVLFPVVMLELKYLSPLLKSFDLSLSTFIGNAISVSLISFPLMPLVIYILGWWIQPKSKVYTYLGTLFVFILYCLEIFLFSYLT